jgi:hypothetical protein
MPSMSFARAGRERGGLRAGARVSQVAASTQREDVPCAYRYRLGLPRRLEPAAHGRGCLPPRPSGLPTPRPRRARPQATAPVSPRRAAAAAALAHRRAPAPRSCAPATTGPPQRHIFSPLRAADRPWARAAARARARARAAAVAASWRCGRAWCAVHHPCLTAGARPPGPICRRRRGAAAPRSGRLKGLLRPAGHLRGHRAHHRLHLLPAAHRWALRLSEGGGTTGAIAENHAAGAGQRQRGAAHRRAWQPELAMHVPRPRSRFGAYAGHQQEQASPRPAAADY